MRERLAMPAAPHVSAPSPCGLYLHVPFCRARCAFCAFYLEIVHEARVHQYLEMLHREIEWAAAQDMMRDRTIHTVYLGGGTPTTLSSEQLLDIIGHLRQVFRLVPDAEITVEAHPESVTAALLDRLGEAGVTRLSLGAESFDRHELIHVGRPSAPELIRRALRLAHAAGFRNINLDLMYGLPRQHSASWLATLEETLALDPTHISCYALTIEEDSPLAAHIAAGRASAPDPAHQTELEQLAQSFLEAAGLTRYEVSNYARPGAECRHNLLYWQNGEYVGLGPSAQSYLGGVRFGNVADLDAYGRLLQQGLPPYDHWEPLTPAQQDRESVVFGLRHIDGVDRTVVDRLSEDPGWRDRLESLLTDAWLELTPHRLRLSDRGRTMADSIAVRLL